MPSWKTVGTVVGVGSGALFLTCPPEDSFDEFFAEYYRTKMWPIIKRKENDNPGNDDNRKSDMELVKWLKKTANKVTDVFEKEVLFAILFPSGPKFEMYHLFRIAKIKMYTDQCPKGFDLVFIGAANGWFLNPVQNVMFTQLCAAQN